MTPPDEETLAAIVAAFARLQPARESSHGPTALPQPSRWRAAGRRYDEYDAASHPKREAS